MIPPIGLPDKHHQESHFRAQRQEFLAAVARLGSIAAAAQDLGINRSTFQKWANVAGSGLNGCTSKPTGPVPCRHG
ncbi:helix-turn-helix domain-containing protein [Arthrobacter polaris]|uniref:helix-turn-helix domain-containing protein n=1 Tax=Arthrobacter polaris TaxID=2813727 RepID=UPI0038991665